MNINKIPKSILAELEQSGLNGQLLAQHSPNQILIIYANNKRVPFDMSLILDAFDLILATKNATTYPQLPNKEKAIDFLMAQGLTPETTKSMDKGTLMGALISATHPEYQTWGKPLTKILGALRQAFLPYEESATVYAPCREISSLEINNNAVKFNFNSKTKTYEDEKSSAYSKQYLLSVESRSARGFKSMQLSMTEVATLLMAIHKANSGSNTENSQRSQVPIAQRESTSIVVVYGQDKDAQLFHNTADDNRFVALKEMDAKMLYAKCLELLKLSTNLSGGELLDVLGIDHA
ncbi:MAG: hypothetical protein ACTIM4_15940 [Marinomonas sp.]